MSLSEEAPPLPLRRILGVDFFIGPLELAVDRAMGERNGGTTEAGRGKADRQSGGPEDGGRNDGDQTRADPLRPSGPPPPRTSGLPDCGPSGHPAFRTSGLPDCRPSAPPPSGLPSSVVPPLCPSGLPAFRPSGPPDCRPSVPPASGLRPGGLVVAPSAPGLSVDLVRAPSYREALQTADLVLTDSGFMVLLWRLFTGEKLPRHSGLKFLRAVLDRPELKEPGAVFWVMPSAGEDARNRSWLVAQGFPVTEADTYLAPAYPASGALVDDTLVARLTSRRPRVVMLAIGGGVQERLGCTLRAQLPYRPGILCLGAAIAFLTGGQASIPPWADRLMLGWLLRLLSNPRKFWRRYWESLRLAGLLWRCRERLPELAGR